MSKPLLQIALDNSVLSDAISSIRQVGDEVDIIEAGSVEKRYLDAIIEKTHELGPFYILAPGLAMPHDRPESGVIKDSFSFVTLKNEVTFPDGQKVDILVGLAATSADIHNSEAIPQIVELFDDEESFEKIRNAESVEELIAIISKK